MDGKILHIGVSIGIALYPLHGDNAMQLVRYADEAMYEAKKLLIGYRFLPALH
ncbi:diguanylate cyclase domain-containing protein [Methylophaga sp. SB9B]|uniref:diguanylate cyclase domain-containing protein n=1 Tax=Methylophaga sp. SB9B TaxID=2570356 RepID=UPI001FFEAFA2|nr:diguanylate cyclase [Methylophaga sp. SB9B]